jgi:branched-chain amino acid transport system substrate-binding protein
MSKRSWGARCRGWPICRGILFGGWLGLVVVACQRGPPTGPPMTIGLIAPLSGSSAASGEAIQRGMLLAIAEVNQDGGVLGRPLALAVRDVPNDPPAGVAALRELVAQQGIVAVFGGIFSPVMLAQLEVIHDLQLPLINPWGSLTAITRNGRSPNYAFRVAASDEQADEFLARYTRDVVRARRPGILADTTAWGEANAVSLEDWFARLGTPPAGIERFAQGDTNMRRQLARLQAADTDALLLIAPPPEGAAIVRGMVTLDWKVPLVSHWGISGGRFVELAGLDNAEGVLTLQTFSFVGPLSARAEAVLQAYHARFGTRRVEEVLAPVGVAHAYDGVRLLAQAIRQAGTTAGPQVREALEHLTPYDGLVKRYAPAFTPERHDPLFPADYLMAVYRGGRLVPAPQPRLHP